MLFSIPYDRKTMELTIPDHDIVAVLEAKSRESPNSGEDFLVEQALSSPLGTQSLRELAKGKKRITLVTSDHTRAMPSRITLPHLLREIRFGNPGADITILIATGLHRPTTEEEQRSMFGDEIVDREHIVVNDAFCLQDFVYIGTLPSGAGFHVNRYVTECDLLVTEGFVEPHFFAGFSGGRKSILPGCCNAETVNQNHCFQAIASPYAIAGVLENNPIHTDMLWAARKVQVQFSLNVALNAEKRIIAAFAGDLEKSHMAGCDFVRSRAEVEAVKGKIVVTSNGGYPLDQNLYQSAKSAATAEHCCKPGGVIVLFCACADGMGGKRFEKIMLSGAPLQIEAMLRSIPSKETISEQWCAQIYARILQKHRVILVTDHLDHHIAASAGFIPASTAEKAMELAYNLISGPKEVVVIPDGVAVLAVEAHIRRSIALKVHDQDNVATIFSEGTSPGTMLEVRDKKGNAGSLKAQSDIPYGHKIALENIAPGERIKKYGEVIGTATKDIVPGDHVHVHNLASTRGRGDL